MKCWKSCKNPCIYLMIWNFLTLYFDFLRYRGIYGNHMEALKSSGIFWTKFFDLAHSAPSRSLAAGWMCSCLCTFKRLLRNPCIIKPWSEFRQLLTGRRLNVAWMMQFLPHHHNAALFCHFSHTNCSQIDFLSQSNFPELKCHNNFGILIVVPQYLYHLSYLVLAGRKYFTIECQRFL